MNDPDSIVEDSLSPVRRRLREAIGVHRGGDLTGAEAGYRDVLREDPENTDALQLLGVVAAQLGDVAAAIEHVRRSIEINPRQPGAFENLGKMLVEQERLDEASEAYRRATELNPDSAQAHRHLGHVYDSLDRPLEAIRCYRRANELDGSDPDSWALLGNALAEIGEDHDAIDVYRQGIELHPDNTYLMDLIGKSLRVTGRLNEASEIYRRWLEIEPGHPAATHLLNACDPTSEPPRRASDDYVRHSFDQFADHFEQRLGELGYQLPQRVETLTKDLFPAERHGTLRVVDLGCGTGLCGPPLRPLSAKLLGVDLSPSMLEKARQRDVYDDLIEAELEQYLRDSTQPFDLIFSADTLIYIGDLRSTFEAAAGALNDGGFFVFSLERLDTQSPPVDGGDYRLDVSGRYQHEPTAILRLLAACGFEPTDSVDLTLRLEGRQAVPGIVYLARRSES